VAEENVAPEIPAPTSSAEELRDVLVKRYAQAAGVDEDTARRVLEVLRAKRPSRFERIKAMLEMMSEYKDKVDPTFLPILRPLIVQELGAVSGGDGIGDRIARAIEEVSAAKLAVEAAGRILGEQPQQQVQVPEQVLKTLESLSKAVEELKVLQVDYEFLARLVERLEKAYNMALASMCSSCKEKFLMNLALRKVVEV